MAIPVGLQLYSVREDCARDLPGTLAAVAKMGYAGVEFAGYHGRTAQELRRMLDDLGLKCCGTHIPLDTLLGDALPQTAEFNLTLGNPYLVVPWLPEERRSSPDAWRATADLFNEIAQRLRPYGLRVGYHNHDIEFKPFPDGTLPFDIFFTRAAPEVIMQLDIGNAMHGGADPLVFLRRYADRAATVHLKEYSASNPVVALGEGDVPWEEVWAVCEVPGRTEWYIVEQESYPVPPLEVVARCLEALRRMGRA